MSSVEIGLYLPGCLNLRKESNREILIIQIKYEKAAMIKTIMLGTKSKVERVGCSG